MLNALTIDVEDWYQTQDFNLDIKDWDHYEDRVERGTRMILDLLARHKVKATFFILGYIARKHPGLIRKIQEGGHEIGSHGYWHQMVFKQDRDEFRKDLVLSKTVLEDITGRAVRMYRASSWSITRDSIWALEILEDEGFICDSSMQPFKTPLSGIDHIPLKPFHPIVDGRRLKLFEFPSTVLKLGSACLPFSGGFYLRAVPSWLSRAALHLVNQERSAMVYVHPWELDIDQPRLQVPPHLRLIHYYNLSTSLQKLDKLLNHFQFSTLGDVLELEINTQSALQYEISY